MGNRQVSRCCTRVQVHMSNGNISLWELPADLNQPMPKDPVKSCAALLDMLLLA